MAGLVLAIHVFVRKDVDARDKRGHDESGKSEFPMRATSESDWRTRTCRIALLVVLGAMLAGCDKCGDWWSPMRGDSQSCRDQAPRPQ
jgi:hypothetical protein